MHSDNPRGCRPVLPAEFVSRQFVFFLMAYRRNGQRSSFIAAGAAFIKVKIFISSVCCIILSIKILIEYGSDFLSELEKTSSDVNMGDLLINFRTRLNLINEISQCWNKRLDNFYEKYINDANTWYNLAEKSKDKKLIQEAIERLSSIFTSKLIVSDNTVIQYQDFVQKQQRDIIHEIADGNIYTFFNIVKLDITVVAWTLVSLITSEVSNNPNDLDEILQNTLFELFEPHLKVLKYNDRNNYKIIEKFIYECVKNKDHLEDTLLKQLQLPESSITERNIKNNSFITSKRNKIFDPKYNNSYYDNFALTYNGLDVIGIIEMVFIEKISVNDIDHMNLSKNSQYRLNLFDEAVYNAIAFLWKIRTMTKNKNTVNEYITENIIFQILSLNKDKSQSVSRNKLQSDIAQSIEKMMRTIIDTEKIDEYNGTPYKGSLLPAQIISDKIKINGQEISNSIRLYDTLPLYEIDKNDNEILNIPLQFNANTSQLPFNKNKENIIILNYILKKVSLETNCYIDYDTLIDSLQLQRNYKNFNDKRYDLMKKVRNLLLYLKQQKFITDYKEIEETTPHKKILGVEILKN